MIPILITVLFGALCMLLLKRINPLPVFPARNDIDIVQRIQLRKTRTGQWIARGIYGFCNRIAIWLRNPELIAANAAAGAAGLSPDDLRAMVCELLDLDHDADDDSIRSTFKTFGDESDEEKAENEANQKRHAEACKALGIAENSKPEELHAAILTVPTKITAANDLTVNERKERSKLLLDVAINEGRISTEDRAGYETAFSSDFPATIQKLEKERPRMNLVALNIGARKQVVANAQERQITIDAAVNERMDAMSKRGQTPNYDLCFTEVQNDPKFKDIFDQMQKPEGAEKKAA